MMRARGHINNSPIASTYQYRPDYLLYRTGDQDLQRALDPTRAGNLTRTGRLLHTRMAAAGAAPDVLASWDILARHDGRIPRDREPDCQPAIQWLTRHGASIGARIPSPQERSSALGLGSYGQGLQLTPVALFDAQGDAFDRNILGLCAGPAIQSFLAGDAPPTTLPQWRHSYSTPRHLQQLYDDLAVTLRQGPQGRNLHPAPNPLTTQDQDGVTLQDLWARLRPTPNPPLG